MGSISCADALRELLWGACKQFDGFSSKAAVNHLRSGAAKDFNSLEKRSLKLTGDLDVLAAVLTA